MKKKLIYIFLLFVFLCCNIISCSKEKDNINNKIDKEKVEINNGAIIENIKGEYSNYNYSMLKYDVVNVKEIIAAYDYNSNNYIGQKDNKYIANYNGNIIELKNVTTYDTNFNLSPNGEYLSFFRTDESNKFFIVSLKNGEYINLNINVSISGKYLDWLDEETIIYYGVRDEDKKNAIFTYNLKTKQENIFTEITEGYVEFIKTLKNEVLFIKGSFEGNKELIKINISDNNTEILSDEISKMNDIVFVNNAYYILGKFTNKDFALYKLKDKNYSRVTYGFPYYIDEQKGLMVTEDNKILFIGGSNNDRSVEEVYMCDEEDNISLLSSRQGEINFIRRYTHLG